MLILTSPAKTLDYTTPFVAALETHPQFLKEATEIMEQLKKQSKEALIKLLEVNSDIAQLNYERFQAWQAKHTSANSRPAIVAYDGDIYQQIHEKVYNERQIEYMQNSLRIISGLYGLLRPYDLIQPYRLEMKARLKTLKGKDLYEFWDNKLTDALNKEILAKNETAVVNLASEEYVKAVNADKLKVKLIHVIFNQQKNGKVFNYGLLAKKARGMMIDFMVKNQVYDVKQLETFDADGYKFMGKTPTSLLFMKEM